MSLWVLAACGTEDPVEPNRPRVVRAALKVEPATVMPGQTALVTATATLPETLMLRQAQFRIEAFGTDTTFNLPVEGPGPHEWGIYLRFDHGPFEGELRFRLIARIDAAADTADATLRVQDDGHPRLRLQVPAVVEPPDTLLIALEAEDAAGITDLTVRIRGAATRDTVLQYDYAPQAMIRQTLWLPRSTPLGDSLVVTVETHDGFGKAANAAGTVRVADTTYPSMAVYLDTLDQNTPIDMSYFPILFFPGDSMHVHLSASDNYGLEWIGYNYLGSQDSLRVDSTAGAADFHFEVPTNINTDYPLLTFVRDRAGHRSAQWVFATIMDGTFRRFEEIRDYPASPRGYALDEQRDMLYFAGYPGTAVHRLSLTPLTAMPPIEFGRYVASVGLSPSGDSLWALLADHAPVAPRSNLLVGWDIARGPGALDTIRLTELSNCVAHSMRTLTGNRALVTGWPPAGCPTIEVDLGSGTRRVRDFPPQLQELAGAPDLRTVVAWNETDAAVYVAESNVLGPIRTLYTGTYPNQEPAFDRSGTSILMRNRLYDRDLSTFRWLGETRDMPAAQALSWDGATAFVGSLPGYWRIDAASGVTAERIILPRRAGKLVPHPDGQRLIVFGWNWVGAVDLR